MAQNQVQPIFILPEGTTKTSGRNAQKLNIEAASLVADQVRTTLGPKGMDKMIVDSLGDVIITNDGVTILREMNIEHPSAKMIVEIAKTQEDEVGDGTTTAVIMAGAFLKEAGTLLDMQVHPTVISKGYRLAAKKAVEILDTIAVPVKVTDSSLLKDIASTAMTGKGAESDKERLSNLIVDAVTFVAQGTELDLSTVKLEKKVGASTADTELIKGIVLDKEAVHTDMPKNIQTAKIALIDEAIEVKDTETDLKVQITQPDQLQAFLDKEEQMIKDKVDQIVACGANVVFCQKGIDDLAQYLLSKKGIFAARRVAKTDMEKLASATGAKIVTNMKDIATTDLGQAGLVEELKVGDESMTFVRECPNPKSVTILVRGGTEHVVDEIKRALDDALGAIKASLKSGKVIAGAGSVEMELSKQLKKYAESLSGKEQLAVVAFANSIEVVPRTLAESAGFDPIDKLAELRAAHDQGKTWAGIDVFTGAIQDAWNQHIIEPSKVKIQAIQEASEVTNLILRIDDVIAGHTDSSARPPEMPPGMGGGMPGMM